MRTRGHDSEELINVLREILIPPPQVFSNSEETKLLSNLKNSCVEVLDGFFQNNRNDDKESAVAAAVAFLNELNHVELESIFYLSLMSLQAAHTSIILDLFSQVKMLDTFSNFLSKNLRILDGFSYQLDDKESLRSILNLVANSRIIEGISSFIINQELNSHDLYFTMILIAEVPSFAGNETIANALLKHTEALCKIILSKNELWCDRCWDTIRIIEKIPLVINNQEIQTAISRQVEFIVGCTIFGLPDSGGFLFPGYILNSILEIQVLLKYNDIQNAICFCLHFIADSQIINSHVVSRIASMDVMLKSPLIREALLDKYRYEISLASKYNREFSAKEVRDVAKNIKETAYPLATIMAAYFTPRAWKHAAIRESATFRLDDVAIEIESSHHEEYEWWNYSNDHSLASRFLQIEIMFENEAVVSALRERKSELLNDLKYSDERVPKEYLEKAFAALGVFLSEYDGDFHEKKELAKVDEVDDAIVHEEITLYDLVELWTHPRHPWTVKVFHEILSRFMNRYDREDPIASFDSEFPEESNRLSSFRVAIDERKTIVYSEGEKKSKLACLLPRYEQDLRNKPLTRETARFYSESLLIIAEDEDDA